MELMRWMGWMYVRFVAVSVAILGGVMFFNNLTDRGFTTWEWLWILVSGLAGMIGGIVFLLTVDGPSQFRKRWVRAASWVAMMAAVLLPTSLTLMLAPLTLLLGASLFVGWRESGNDERDTPVTSG